MIGSPADLPPCGVRESDRLEFKSYSPDITRPERLAIMVATLANHYGGAIIFGARAHDDVLAAYDGVPDADELRNQICDACFERLSPRLPDLKIIVMAKGPAQLVIANVPPAPTFVGVSLNGGRYRFPVRVGDRGGHLSPEDLERRMTGTRGARLLLEQIPQKARLQVRLIQGRPVREDLTVRVREIEDWHIRLDFPVGGGTRSANVPLSAVKGVWPATDGKRYCLYIVGEVVGDQYWPPGTSRR